MSGLPNSPRCLALGLLYTGTSPAGVCAGAGPNTYWAYSVADKSALHDRRFSLLVSEPSRSLFAEIDASKLLPVRIENCGYPMLMFPAPIFAESRLASFLMVRDIGIRPLGVSGLVFRGTYLLNNTTTKGT
jgi:hypothetical protein